MYVQTSIQNNDLIFFGYIGIAGSHGSSSFNFLRKQHIFHISQSIYNPTNSAEVFPILHILTSIYCLSSFWWWHYNKHKVVSYSGFDLHISSD